MEAYLRECEDNNQPMSPKHWPPDEPESSFGWHNHDRTFPSPPCSPGCIVTKGPLTDDEAYLEDTLEWWEKEWMLSNDDDDDDDGPTSWEVKQRAWEHYVAQDAYLVQANVNLKSTVSYANTEEAYHTNEEAANRPSSMEVKETASEDQSSMEVLFAQHHVEAYQTNEETPDRPSSLEVKETASEDQSSLEDQFAQANVT